MNLQVGGEELAKHLDMLMPTLILFLQDSSSVAKRHVALWTLGQVVESTGYVVEPYQKYPELLETLMRFLKVEQVHNIRQEVSAL